MIDMSLIAEQNLVYASDPDGAHSLLDEIHVEFGTTRN